MKTAKEILFKQLTEDEIYFDTWYIDDTDRAFDSIEKAMKKFASQNDLPSQDKIDEELNNQHTITLSEDGEYINQLTYWYTESGKHEIGNFMQWLRSEIQKQK